MPASDQAAFRSLVRDTTAFVEAAPSDADLDRAEAALVTMTAYFDDLVDRRSKHPAHDLVSAMLAVDAGGDQLTREEIVSTAILLFGAGFETTTNLIGNGLRTLLRHPDELARLRSDPTLLNGAIEEILRYESPVQINARTALDDADLLGEPVEAGTLVVTESLRTLEWVDRHENLVVCGPSGTGKTHFLEALGQGCVDAGHKVSWFSLEDLGGLVRRHGADDTTGRAIKKIMRADVIVIDDIGLLPVATETAEALYRVVDAAYEKRSIALSSNLHPAGFDELMPKTIANATVDRLMHHAHVVLTAGDSIRLTQATAGKGVTPLTH